MGKHGACKTIPSSIPQTLRTLSTIKIADIKVGKRVRKNMGDIAGLAASIEDLGLLNPITVDERGCLLAGARRLAACKRLGWKEVPVNVVRAA